MEREVRIKRIRLNGGLYRATLYIDNVEAKSVEGVFLSVMKVVCEQWVKEGHFSLTTDLAAGDAIGTLFRLSGICG